MSFTKEQVEEMQRRVEQLSNGERFARKHNVLSDEEVICRLKAGIPVPIAMPVPRSAIVIDIDPIGAPRQSRRDAWKPSPRVLRYRAWKDRFRPACEAAGWKLGPVFHAEFEIAMPASWSKKKKVAMNGQPHQQKFDVDNLTKACLDAFGEDDAFVHTLQVTKRWAENGRIILYY